MEKSIKNLDDTYILTTSAQMTAQMLDNVKDPAPNNYIKFTITEIKLLAMLGFPRAYDVATLMVNTPIVNKFIRSYLNKTGFLGNMTSEQAIFSSLNEILTTRNIKKEDFDKLQFSPLSCALSHHIFV